MSISRRLLIGVLRVALSPAGTTNLSSGMQNIAKTLNSKAVVLLKLLQRMI
jgi:hypothetical protein